MCRFALEHRSLQSSCVPVFDLLLPLQHSNLTLSVTGYVVHRLLNGKGFDLVLGKETKMYHFEPSSVGSELRSPFYPESTTDTNAG